MTNIGSYMVSVRVVNDSEHMQEPMEFRPIDGLPPERFTQVVSIQPSHNVSQEANH